jgi:PEGA domain/Tetratricopeptide repeat
MGGRRIALIVTAALTALVISSAAFAQSKDPGGDIEMEPEQADSPPKSAADGAPGAITPPAAPGKDPKLAKKWIIAGQQLMQKGSAFAAKNRSDEAKTQFENAVTAYQKAIEASDDVNVYFELANAEDKLGKIDEAVKHLRRVVNAQAGVRPDVLKKATARFEELSAKVGLVTLTVTPAGTSITLGGAELGTAPLPEPLVLMPGTYTLSFQADGFQPKEAEIKIDPGSESERAVALEPVKIIVEPVKPAIPDEPLPQDDKPVPPSKAPLYVGAGIAGAGIVSAATFGILAIGQHSTFTSASTSKLDREDARTNGQRFALISDISLGTAVVAAGFTTYWYFYKYRHSPPKSEDRHPPPVEAKLDVVPWVQSQSGGITIAGRF